MSWVGEVGNIHGEATSVEPYIDVPSIRRPGQNYWGSEANGTGVRE